MLALPAAIAVAGAPPKCSLNGVLQLPVTLEGLRPIVVAQVNGSEQRFLLDSGAFYSMISAGKAAELGLTLTATPMNHAFDYAVGVGGRTSLSVTTIKEFKIASMTVPNMQFLVGGNEMGSSAAGLLGQNFLRWGDVEYDLSKGIVRVMKAKDCERTDLAYWAGSTEAYSSISIEPTTPAKPHAIGQAYLNGKKIRVLFDTGASSSFLSRAAAERAGVKRHDSGVSESGSTFGIGHSRVATWTATFASLKIGDEEIKNARLRIGDVDLNDWDMLVGADFFLSHHLLISNSQHRLYFTYNGGPVFNLDAARDQQGHEDADAPPVAAPPEQKAAAGPASAADAAAAAATARQGAARSARHDYDGALADLSAAIALDPQQASYYYERAVAYRYSGRVALSIADFDRAVELNPDDARVRLARAETLLGVHREADAVRDLDRVDALLAAVADERRDLARLYLLAAQGPSAVRQYGLWIDAHPHDVGLAGALERRCMALVVLKADLDRALADCNRALKLVGDTGSLLMARGLVRLQRGEADKAIVDFDASLKLGAPRAMTLYLRGYAKRSAGPSGAGEADMNQAMELDATVAERTKWLEPTPR